VKPPRPYANPYLAGVCLGLVLLAAYVITGQGLGASGAFANVATGVVSLVSAKEVASNGYFHSYAAAGAPWSAWIVVEVVGIVIGGAISAALAGRFNVQIVRGHGAGARSRLWLAAAGGLAMGVGAVLARGCTSGQALSGGALLSVGSWVFMITAFAAGFGVAPLLRKSWR